MHCDTISQPMSLCFVPVRFSLNVFREAVESAHGTFLGYKFGPPRIATKTTVRCAKLYQKQRGEYFDRITTSLVTADKIFLRNDKIKRNYNFF